MGVDDRIRVVIVDDIAETRENIRKLLQFENDIEVVGVARTGSEGINVAKEMRPDVILMGGVDTATTLFMKDAVTVKKVCEESIAEGIQILAPSCAVAPSTPTENLLAMVEVAKAHQE